MTALSTALILAIRNLQTVIGDLQVVLTLIDTGGVARKEEASTERVVRTAGVSEREHQLLVLLARGMSNGEIGAQIGIAESTVKNSLSRVYRKLHVEDRLQAAVLAHKLGLVDDLITSVSDIVVLSKTRRDGPKQYRLGPNSRLGANEDVPRSLVQKARDAKIKAARNPDPPP